MDDATIRQSLAESGLRETAVDKLLESYKKMQTRYQEEEYAEVGIHVGRFCEVVVNLLRLRIVSELTEDNVRNFAQECIHGDFAADYSDAISRHIPNMLNTAYDIRSNRDAAHLNLETAVNQADARLGIALCSSMLVELLREFVEIDEEEEVNELTTIIYQLSEPVEESPLDSLITSRHDFNQSEVARALENIVVIVDEDGTVEPSSHFYDLSKNSKITALGLGRLAAYELDYLDTVGENTSWFKDRSDSPNWKVEDVLEDLDFFTLDYSHGGHYIPGYLAGKAVARLNEER